jgi:chorismate mutase
MNHSIINWELYHELKGTYERSLVHIRRALSERAIIKEAIGEIKGKTKGLNMNVAEIKEKLAALAEAYHKRDLSDPEIRELDPEGFVIEWDALELIANYAVKYKVKTPGFDKEKFLRIYNTSDEDTEDFLWQNHLMNYIKTKFNPNDKKLDAGFREIVSHYLEVFSELS